MESAARVSVQPIEVLRVGPSGAERRQDVAAAEEPLEIRLHGSRFIITMRTPGADRELVAGFLLSEQMIGGAGDIGTIRHCTDGVASTLGASEPGDAADVENVLDVTLVGDAASRAALRLTERRLVMTTSACGVCGRRSIDDLMRDLPRITAAWAVPHGVIASLADRLRAAQSVFDETGGLHAAGLFDRTGTLMAIAEDVGRHNAVDKVIGSQLLLGRLPLSDRLLFVSGRTSFEIVQKAVVAGIAVVAAVSAPSSLAIQLARDAGVTLVGFVRGDSFNVYTGAERITL